MTLTIRQILDKRVKCPSCKTNGWLCGINPLHIWFKFLTYTTDGRMLNKYIYSSVPQYTHIAAYGWFYEGLRGLPSKYNPAHYEGIVYNLGVQLAKKYALTK